jgi:uncharacterized membrane protein
VGVRTPLNFYGGRTRYYRKLRNEPKSRVESVDALRGLVMIIMALDHVRDFFHADATSFSPEDLTRTTTALFLTRWITHICAPVFMFTAGLGAFYWLQRGRSKPELTEFLVKRGLWLVLLELTYLHFALFFNFTSDPYLLTVLWALGWSMVALGVLVYLPFRVLAVLSIATIALHNLLDSAPSTGWLSTILHRPGVIYKGPPMIRVAYPLVPWIAVMAAGFCFGRIMQLDTPVRRRWLVCLGSALTLAFIAIRAINRYGDPAPWSAEIPGTVVLSFLKCTKYPPSLDFLLMTLGPAMLLLAWFERLQFAPTNPLMVFGRVPLFYFLAHFLLAHVMALALEHLGGHGYSLGAVYLSWIGVVAVLYPVCLWYGRLKKRGKGWWLSYL